MFTVKHYRHDGITAVSSCDSYEVKGSEVTTFIRSVEYAVIEVGPRDSLFIENIAGKTVTAIRPKD